jgi:hypothetical protein
MKIALKPCPRQHLTFPWGLEGRSHDVGPYDWIRQTNENKRNQQTKDLATSPEVRVVVETVFWFGLIMTNQD